MGGSFTRIGGQARNAIARIGNDGSVDSTADVWQFSPLGLRLDGRVVATKLMPPSFANHILQFNPPQPALQSLSAIRYDNGSAP